jgi:hypothetical protein
MLGTGCWVLGTWYWMLDARCWILDAGYWMLDAWYFKDIEQPVLATNVIELLKLNLSSLSIFYEVDSFNNSQYRVSSIQYLVASIPFSHEAFHKAERPANLQDVPIP